MRDYDDEIDGEVEDEVVVVVAAAEVLVVVAAMTVTAVIGKLPIQAATLSLLQVFTCDGAND